MIRFFFITLICGCSSVTQRKLTTSPPLADLAAKGNRAQFEAQSKNFVAATQGARSTQAAIQIFKKGGNIVDAAVAASFMSAVERPHGTGIGGGGFLVYFDSKLGKTLALDFRERAPSKAFKNMFLNSGGEVVADLSSEGILSAGVPGFVSGLVEFHKKFGKLRLEAVLKPAIDLSAQGFPIYEQLAEALNEMKPLLLKFEASRKIYVKTQGVWKVGDRLVQRDLSNTLKKIAKKGAAAFYSGKIARAIERENIRLGGLITRRDLNNYKTYWVEPLRSDFGDFEIVTMPPPSSGGTHIVQILKMLSADPLTEWGRESVEYIHHLASAMQLAFADRAKFLGDDRFVRVPMKGLLSAEYLDKRRKEINSARSKRASEIQAGNASEFESSDTTHMSFMDSEGNALATTQTHNGWMGSGVVVPGTGILLNNEMDDFSAKTGSANIFGAIGGEANSIEAGKTPLSSMSPTIVFKRAKPVLTLGAMGGTRILTCVAQTILNRLIHNLSLFDSIASVRVHHQWQPDKLKIETPSFTESVQMTLKAMGYELDVSPSAVGCRVMAAERDGDVLRAVSDPRDFDIGNASGL